MLQVVVVDLDVVQDVVVDLLVVAEVLKLVFQKVATPKEVVVLWLVEKEVVHDEDVFADVVVLTEVDLEVETLVLVLHKLTLEKPICFINYIIGNYLHSCKALYLLLIQNKILLTQHH